MVSSDNHAQGINVNWRLYFALLCVAYYVLSTSSILSELVTHNDTHELIIISVCRFPQRIKKIHNFYYLQIYDDQTERKQKEKHFKRARRTNFKSLEARIIRGEML